MSDSAPKRRLTLAGLAGAREGGAPVRERLTSMLFLAALAHAIVILGLSFGVASHPGSAAPGMEVLLVTDDLPSARSNDRAAYLAQRTQLGAGNTRTLPTGSPETRAPAANAAPEGDAERTVDADRQAGDEHLLTTGAPAPLIRWLGQAGSGPVAALDRQRASGGAPSQGRGDARELVLRGDPKTGRWVSPDTRASRLAPYLDAWRRKVERVGTLNFPSAARRADLSGSPVIEVALGSDGRLLEATVQRGSGHPQIDQAALLILRLASPFEPFPRELARNYSALRFAYQWDFFAGQLGAGAVTAGTNGAPGP